MAKDDRIEALLVEWAQWLLVGDGSGYATMSVLHVDWSPPSPGVTPTLKTNSSGNGARTHRAIGQLSQRLSNTLVVHYCLRLPLAEQAERLECSISTVVARVAYAHTLLREELLQKKSFTSY